jgi:DNA-directed RNA polymerase specialized sigma24 family protein
MSVTPSRAEDGLDPQLRPLVRESNSARREQLIEGLLFDVGTVVARTLQRKLRWPLGGRMPQTMAEDVQSTVLLRLLKRIRTIGAPGDTPIENFAGYATVVTTNVCDDFMRETFPQRALLKNRIRYLLMRDARFAIWQAGDRTLCGFAGWRRRSDSAEPRALDVASIEPLDAILTATFAATGSPVALDRLVGAIATLIGLQSPQVSAPEAIDEHLEPAFHTATETRDLLARIWSEIRALNRPQRVALLLNLRDAAGDAATPLLVLTGVATIEEIAETLEMKPLEFAAIFNDLPLGDHAIASLLGVTRQQVINLRSAARKRLARRASQL